MPQRTATIGSSVGLHARPATLFVQAATKTGLAVNIAKEGGGDPVDARSLLAVMALGAGHGDKVILSAEGDEAESRLAELVTLLETDLDA